MIRLFLDMDGVLCNFVDSAVKQLGVTDYSIPNGLHNIEEWPGINISKSKFWKAIDAGGEDFWSNLDKYPWTDELLKISREYSTFILTAPASNPVCFSGKIKWLYKHAPWLVRNVIITSHKYLLAGGNKDNILVDDNDSKISMFNGFGGTGILFPQQWNTNYDVVGDRIGYVQDRLTHAAIFQKRNV